MPNTPFTRVLAADGTPKLRADGTPLFYDAYGQCIECCGGEGEPDWDDNTPQTPGDTASDCCNAVEQGVIVVTSGIITIPDCTTTAAGNIWKWKDTPPEVNKVWGLKYYGYNHDLERCAWFYSKAVPTFRIAYLWPDCSEAGTYDHDNVSLWLFVDNTTPMVWRLEGWFGRVGGSGITPWFDYSAEEATCVPKAVSNMIRDDNATPWIDPVETSLYAGHANGAATVTNNS